MEVHELDVYKRQIYENDKDQKTTVKKGEKSILGFDGAIHRLKQRTIIIPDDSFEIVGYCAAGLAEFITAWLDKNLDLENALKKSEYSVDDVRAVSYTHLDVYKRQATRGNGEEGSVITENVKTFMNVPLTIDYKGHIKITGEGIIHRDDFEYINSNIEDENDRYSTPRNLASGSVQQLDPGICAQRRVYFYAFNVVEEMCIRDRHSLHH